MAFTERLAILISADGDAAIKELGKVGDAAEKDLGRASTAADQWGSRFVRSGALMVGAAAAMGVGLFKAAQAFDEANQSEIRLQNTLKNNPLLAGQSIDSFKNLADSIQKKTAADGDAVIAGMAMLGTFRVTGDQIKQLTPLVVDYARKFGVDLVDANAAVGKALDGQSGALKRNGVTIDEATFATDRFRAVQEALRTQVGGFAAQEGKTFSGQLERMRNNLGDLQESIGSGVVGVFNKLLPVISKVTEGFKGIDSSTGGAVGQFAAFATIGLGTVGTLLLVVGSVIKAKLAMQEMAAASAVMRGTMTALQVGLPIVGTFVALAVAGNSLAKAFGESSQKLDLTADAFRRMTQAQLESTAVALASAPTWVGFTGQLKELAKESPVTAQAVLDASGLQGRARAELQRIIDQEVAAQERSKAASEAETVANAAVTATLSERIQKQYELLNAQLGLVGAQLNVESAQNRYNVALFTTGENSLETRQAALSLAQAQAALGKATQDAAVQAGESAEQASVRQVAALEFVSGTLDPSSPLRKNLQDYIDSIKNSPEYKRTQFDVVYTASFMGGAPPAIYEGPPPYPTGGFDDNVWTPFAMGGVVTGPTRALIGEAGPEAVIPLGRGAGMGTTINLVLDGQVISQVVRDDLIRIGRANGSALGRFA